MIFVEIVTTYYSKIKFMDYFINYIKSRSELKEMPDLIMSDSKIENPNSMPIRLKNISKIEPQPNQNPNPIQNSQQGLAENDISHQNNHYLEGKLIVIPNNNDAKEIPGAMNKDDQVRHSRSNLDIMNLNLMLRKKQHQKFNMFENYAPVGFLESLLFFLKSSNSPEAKLIKRFEQYYKEKLSLENLFLISEYCGLMIKVQFPQESLNLIEPLMMNNLMLKLQSNDMNNDDLDLIEQMRMKKIQ